MVAVHTRESFQMESSISLRLQDEDLLFTDGVEGSSILLRLFHRTLNFNTTVRHLQILAVQKDRVPGQAVAS